MTFSVIKEENWSDIKEIYLEAFPKRERKPFEVLRRSVKRGRVQIFTAMEGDLLMGFTAVIPFQNMVMVDYLAVSGKIRSKGTGSYMMQEICRQYAGKKIVLLIERLDDQADNKEQRIARRRFYLKNGLTSSDLFITGAGGEMEVLNYGEKVTGEEYLRLQKYALGKLFFWLSRIKIV